MYFTSENYPFSKGKKIQRRLHLNPKSSRAHDVCETTITFASSSTAVQPIDFDLAVTAGEITRTNRRVRVTEKKNSFCLCYDSARTFTRRQRHNSVIV